MGDEARRIDVTVAAASCDPANNLCCQVEPAICTDDNAFGHRKECCRPQGGHCTTSADCCYDIADFTFGRDSCGTTSIYGGEGTFCSKLEDCVGHETAALNCIGVCFVIGSSGNRYCTSDADCPPINGNGQLCRQKRCIDFQDLPE